MDDIREQLVISASNFGFDSSWVTTLQEKYGDGVLATVVEGAREGVSVNIIVEVVDVFGPNLLQVIVEWINKHRMAAAAKAMGITAFAK